MRGTPPPYFPNLVTMRAGEATSQQQRLIRHIVASDPGRSFGFKDSFCSIDPVSAGGDHEFRLLFKGTWIWSDAARGGIRKSTIRWCRVKSELELLNWERAWRNDDANQSASAVAHQFPASLLRARHITFLAGVGADDEVVAVAAAMRTGDAIGLCNVVGRVDGAELWAGATDAARAAFLPGLPLVGYQRDDNLGHAISCGFRPIGPLRVYVSNPANA